jgi:hypothetical protein
MNIQMRIITEENIDQLENLTYSKNMDKLMYTTNIEPQKIINEIKKNLTDSMKHPKTPGDAYTPENPDNLPMRDQDKDTNFVEDGDDRMLKALYDVPDSDDNSPPYAPSDSPPYVPKNDSYSPPYAPNGDSYSPPMAPNNDSYSPPMAPTTTGFNMNVGDIVYFRGDNLVGRIWKIRNIGDRFITIETENLQGIEDKDSIKVVTEMDIYRPEDFAYSERNAEPITGVNYVMNGGGHVQKPNINTMGASTPAINFNPVIRINNGGYDLSTDTQPNNTNEMIGGAVENNVIEGGKLNTITDLATMSHNLPTIKVKADNSHPQSGGEEPKDDKIDFTKLIIKKV